MAQAPCLCSRFPTAGGGRSTLLTALSGSTGLTALSLSKGCATPLKTAALPRAKPAARLAFFDVKPPHPPRARGIQYLVMHYIVYRCGTS